ncbi:MAG: hypothetical protein A4E55_02384 [Pelotomaculum sp. PtaU1.Bin035]|nr:MAG: hypothetical protein A4E55_02384 [Pelotomaculum sp. PtaU1.Bin035]
MKKNANNTLPAKRVDVVSLKMVREGSFLYGGRRVCTPVDAVEIMRRFLEDIDREVFAIACLNTKNEPLCVSVVSLGTLSSTTVHPREVFKVALLANAASVIIFHNHPSGDPSPSSEDKSITKRLSEAGELLGISVLDHVVIGSGGRFTSFKEAGLFR